MKIRKENRMKHIIITIEGMQFKVIPEIHAKYDDGNVGKLTVTLLGLSDEINKVQGMIEAQQVI
jgi:hypothetical protein